jgi:hypothetical protein
MYSGPKITENGLVFGFDAGTPIANNSIFTRFYKGEPTVNAISNANTMASWTTYYRTVSSSTFTTEFGTTGYRFVNQPSWNGIYRNFNLGSTGFYTFSAWFRYNGGSAANNGAVVYISNYGGGDTQATIDKNKLGIWQRVTFTVNVTSSSNVYFYLISYGGTDNGTGNPDFSSWEVTMPQIEFNSHATPFVTGTRSATNSLIDLTKSSSIDTSTVSFNSNGLPTFDGTNDYLDTTKTATQLGIYDANYTMECVVYFNSVTNDHMIFGTTQPAVREGMHIGCRNGTIYQGHYSADYSAGSVAINTYYHLVWAYNKSTSTATIYKNGVSQGSGTISSFIGATNILIGRFINNYCNAFIPVSKIYNRALSATEVVSNFKAYQKRFNI